MFVEILPNAMGPIIVEATVRLGYAIFAVAGLTFLGFGVQPPSPDWSLQIEDNYPLLSAATTGGRSSSPRSRSPASSIAVNLIADGLRRCSTGERTPPPARRPPPTRSSCASSTSSIASAAATGRCSAACR